MTNMAGCEGDDLASLDVKAITDGAVVELIRKRYNYDKIYVSSVLLARVCLISAGVRDRCKILTLQIKNAL